MFLRSTESIMPSTLGVHPTVININNNNVDMGSTRQHYNFSGLVKCILPFFEYSLDQYFVKKKTIFDLCDLSH